MDRPAQSTAHLLRPGRPVGPASPAGRQGPAARMAGGPAMT
jgi:hypothetical protein